MKRNIKNIIIIALLSISLTVIIIFALINSRFHYNPEGYTGNTSGNLLNKGVFAEYNGTIFFANPADNNKLYKMSSDCTNIKKLSDDSASYINVSDNYIFYIKDNSSNHTNGFSSAFMGFQYGIIRIDHKGNNSHSLASEPITQMVMYGNNLFYTSATPSGYALFSKNIDGKEDEKMLHTSNFSLAGLADGMIYYSNTNLNHHIYTFNCDTSTLTDYLPVNSYLTTMHEGCLYYIDLANGYALTKYDVISQTYTVLYDGRCVNYNVYDDVIFYQTEGNEYTIRRMNTDGSNDVFIANGSAEHISCTSEYTFFNLLRDGTLYYVPTHDGTSVKVLQ